MVITELLELPTLVHLVQVLVQLELLNLLAVSQLKQRIESVLLARLLLGASEPPHVLVQRLAAAVHAQTALSSVILDLLIFAPSVRLHLAPQEATSSLHVLLLMTVSVVAVTRFPTVIQQRVMAQHFDAVLLALLATI